MTTDNAKIEQAPASEKISKLEQIKNMYSNLKASNTEEIVESTVSKKKFEALELKHNEALDKIKQLEALVDSFNLFAFLSEPNLLLSKEEFQKAFKKIEDKETIIAVLTVYLNFASNTKASRTKEAGTDTEAKPKKDRKPYTKKVKDIESVK